jgi:DNA topoisomerase-1
MSKAVVVVESPAKAKTINSYLGKDFTVLASFGHVRDLPSKDGSVEPENDFAMHYEIDAGSKKQIKAIADAVKGAERLYLATDPDREGEAISWHVLEALKEGKSYPKDIDVKRIVFTEITKRAVTHAVETPRDIDMDLVNAQQARRALDYLVGFSLSPVLWRKLPGSRSAGRVQSVALRLLCEREAEIEVFKPQEYWDVSAMLAGGAGQPFRARLIELHGDKLEKLSLKNEDAAIAAQRAVEATSLKVLSITPKTQKRQPFAPFSTSTLQMEASRKLGFGAKRTMQVAQKLYEAGHITYMRTDGITVSQDAIQQARELIGSEYGEHYLPKSPRMYKTKSKNAQEAHEAIRPTDLSKRPERMGALEDDQKKLYSLIWKRMMASQMEAATYDRVAVDIADEKRTVLLRANGSVLKFDGFLCLYQETIEEDQKTDSEKDDDDANSQRLPAMKEGEPLATKQVEPAQHFTQPPPRYSEASLVKRLEELGIGRPSTFASIISVLLDRGYATLEKKRFVASSLGRIVTAFLMTYFTRYVEYDFTADMEERLDAIADGEKEWKQELREFWEAFSKRIEESKELTITDVLNAIDAIMEPYTFGTGDGAEKARICPKCDGGRLSLKTGKFGAFLGCSNYPECNFTRQLGAAITENGDAAAQESDYPRILGTHPDTKEDVSIRKGPYGIYVQLGEEKKPKRTGLPKGMEPESVDLEKAVALLSLPRDIGKHPETGSLIQAGIGRYGPYILHEKKYTSLPAGEDVLSVGMNRAVDLIAEAAKKGGGKATAKVLRNVGTHPETGEELSILDGRYGPYIKFAKKNITIPKEADIENITLEDVLKLLPQAGKKKASAKKKPATKKKA